MRLKGRHTRDFIQGEKRLINAARRPQQMASPAARECALFCYTIRQPRPLFFQQRGEALHRDKLTGWCVDLYACPPWQGEDNPHRSMTFTSGAGRIAAYYFHRWKPVSGIARGGIRLFTRAVMAGNNDRQRAICGRCPV